MKGHYRTIGLVAFFAISSVAAEAPQDGQREAALARVIAASEQHALNAGQVDWPNVKITAAGILRQDDSDAGLSASIRYVLATLQDRHSFYRPPSNPAAADKPGTQAPRVPIAVSSASPAGTPILAINAWGGRDVAQAATDTRQALVAALSHESCGMILDFSQNSGGNMWPMVMGVLPLLSEGMLGGFEGGDGRKTSIVSTGTGLLVAGSGHFLNTLELPQPAFLPDHIAVILGERTASSGEITVLLFKGQDNVRYFGHGTAGVPTANRTFDLPNGATLALTTAVTFDRNGNRYTGAIVPDVETAAPIEAADSWIRGLCSGQRANGSG